MTRPTSRRPRRLSMILAATGLATLLVTLGAGPATALPPGPPTRTYSSQVDFAGTVFDSGAGESVDLVGDLHVLTQPTGSDSDGWTVDWRASFGQASGTGETTGDQYVLDGADAGTVTLPPGPPTRTAFFEPTFTLLPPGPPTHPPSPIRLLLAASFDDRGQVTDVQAHLSDSTWGTTD